MSKHGRKRKSGKRQHGGTLLGLILGLIIGLSIAVGVALTIKNTPIPFSSKMARPGKTIEGTMPDQVTDPNAPLYGNRDAAKEAAREMERKAEEERVAALLQGQTPGQAQGQAAGQGADPRLALAQPNTPTSMDDRYLHYLQVGAFLQRSDAENTRARIALIGLTANITEHKASNGTLYRVRIGPFAQFEAMSRVRGRLVDNGVDVAIVRDPK